MNLFTPNQIARRAVLAPNAFYHGPRPNGVVGSHTTRILHLLVLLAVLHQLIGSRFISRPLPGDALSALYTLHEYIGMASLAIICAFWLWTLVRHAETRLVTLFPWLSPRGIRAIVDDVIGQIYAIRRGVFSGEGNGALASAIHGLGLLVVTAMAATGTVYFFATPSIAHNALALHRLLSNLMWAYILGHAGIAVLHHLLGSDILRRMFWIRRGVTITTGWPQNTPMSSETVEANRR